MYIYISYIYTASGYYIAEYICVCIYFECRTVCCYCTPCDKIGTCTYSAYILLYIYIYICISLCGRNKYVRIFYSVSGIGTYTYYQTRYYIYSVLYI